MTTDFNVNVTSFLLYTEFCTDTPKKLSDLSLKTAKIGIRTSLKSAIYFRLVSQTIHIEQTTFPSRVQNLVKTSKGYCERNPSTTDLFTDTQMERAD